MSENVPDPADDARQLRAGDAEAASRLARRRHRSCSDQTEKEGSDKLEDELGSEEDGPRQRYVDADWDTLIQQVGPELISAVETPGWVTITVDVRRHDGRAEVRRTKVDLSRTDVDHAVVVRLGELFRHLGTCCHGEVRVTVDNEDGPGVLVWAGTAHVGATERWIRAEEARLFREKNRFYRVLYSTLKRRDAMMVRMFSDSALVIQSSATVLQAIRGVNLPPPAPARSGPDLGSVATMIMQGLMSFSGAAGQTTSPPSPPPQHDDYSAATADPSSAPDQDDYLGLGRLWMDEDESGVEDEPFDWMYGQYPWVVEDDEDEREEEGEELDDEWEDDEEEQELLGPRPHRPRSPFSSLVDNAERLRARPTPSQPSVEECEPFDAWAYGGIDLLPPEDR
ncbi:MAG: hypothetical protein H6735_31295 [Alphaproteobacteria bacterium]|nr:hypothetical protein [Alphaproteobacteria bacterium]